MTFTHKMADIKVTKVRNSFKLKVAQTICIVYICTTLYEIVQLPVRYVCELHVGSILHTFRHLRNLREDSFTKVLFILHSFNNEVSAKFVVSF